MHALLRGALLLVSIAIRMNQFRSFFPLVFNSWVFINSFGYQFASLVYLFGQFVRLISRSFGSPFGFAGFVFSEKSYRQTLFHPFYSQLMSLIFVQHIRYCSHLQHWLCTFLTHSQYQLYPFTFSRLVIYFLHPFLKSTSPFILSYIIFRGFPPYFKIIFFS